MVLKDFMDGKIEERNKVIRLLKKRIKKYQKLNPNNIDIIIAYGNRELALEEFMKSLLPKKREVIEDLKQFVR